MAGPFSDNPVTKLDAPLLVGQPGNTTTNFPQLSTDNLPSTTKTTVFVSQSAIGTGSVNPKAPSYLAGSVSQKSNAILEVQDAQSSGTVLLPGMTQANQNTAAQMYNFAPGAMWYNTDANSVMLSQGSALQPTINNLQTAGTPQPYYATALSNSVMLTASGVISQAQITSLNGASTNTLNTTSILLLPPFNVNNASAPSTNQFVYSLQSFILSVVLPVGGATFTGGSSLKLYPCTVNYNSNTSAPTLTVNTGSTWTSVAIATTALTNATVPGALPLTPFTCSPAVSNTGWAPLSSVSTQVPTAFINAGVCLSMTNGSSILYANTGSGALVYYSINYFVVQV